MYIIIYKIGAGKYTNQNWALLLQSEPAGDSLLLKPPFGVAAPDPSPLPTCVGNPGSFAVKFFEGVASVLMVGPSTRLDTELFEGGTLVPPSHGLHMTVMNFEFAHYSNLRHGYTYIISIG